MIQTLYEIIRDRQEHPKEGSYTNELLHGGYERAAQKVGEEAVEVIIAAGSQGEQRLIEESADLIYHWLVLLVQQGVSLQAVEDELRKRHR
jgi:phosphoribosyl-ATP pyrophosphohydrolase